MFSSDNSIGGFHDDVLNAVPSDEESSLKLIEEIKNRAKGSISSHNYRGAITLYTKAIDICPSQSKHMGLKAILFSNRSLCHCSMGKSDNAVIDADSSITSDPTYLKGYFRKVAGLLLRAKGSDLTVAVEHLTHCLNITPDDKAFRKQMVDVQAKIAEQKNSGNNDNSSNSLPKVPVSSNTIKTTAVKIPSATTTTSNKSNNKTETKPLKSESNKFTTENNENNDDTENNDKIRGYKLTSDGRKTTFFNNEMDEQTRALIGDIAPQKISPLDGGGDVVPSNGGSVWNAAGTFESVDHSAWALETLKSTAVSGLTGVANSELLDSVTVKDIKAEGDAQLIGMRGKRKHVCDITATIQFAVNTKNNADNSADNNNDDNVLTIIIRDITSDRDLEFEITYPKTTNTFTNNHKNELIAHVKILKNSITENIFKFLDHFKLK